MFKTKIEIEKSIIIEAPKSEVFQYLVETEKKNKWSPWLIIEPSAAKKPEWEEAEVWYVEYWDWKIVWSWEQEIVDIKKDSYIKNELRFLKPFKSKDSASFELKKLKSWTKVTWKMQWSLPIFMLPIKNMMTKYIEMDFGRGLQMLKDYVETGSLDTETSIWNAKNVREFYYVWFRNTWDMDTMWKTMMDDFAKLEKIFKSEKLEAKEVLAIYNKWDMVKDFFDFTSWFKVSKRDFDKIEKLEIEWLTMDKYEKHKALVTTHKWSYDYLCNSWTGAMMALRSKKLKENRKQPAYEVYINKPWRIKPKNLITEIYVPVKD